VRIHKREDLAMFCVGDGACTRSVAVVTGFQVRSARMRSVRRAAVYISVSVTHSMYTYCSTVHCACSALRTFYSTATSAATCMVWSLLLLCGTMAFCGRFYGSIMLFGFGNATSRSISTMTLASPLHAMLYASYSRSSHMFALLLACFIELYCFDFL
jgi:hypothetical protein